MRSVDGADLSIYRSLLVKLVVSHPLYKYENVMALYFTNASNILLTC